MIINWEDSSGSEYETVQAGFVFNDVSISAFDRTSCSVNRIIDLNYGDKIKVRARMFTGSIGITISDAIRFRIKKTINN